jgi:hypothetical protein
MIRKLKLLASAAFYTVILMMFLSSCKTSQTAVPPFYVSESLRTFDFERLSYLESPNKKHVLCIFIGEGPEPITRYLVYNLEENKLILDKSFVGGTIAWNNDTSVKIMNNSRVDPNSVVIIDIFTGQQIKE